ncbi:MAG TPA: TonB-dependent receptor [Terriglobia bacterium]|nr:TonB-dependent receptor [Terriglobia bacterium]
MAMLLIASTVYAQGSQTFPDVTAISLEDLMNLKVTSVSKRAQKLADAPAAVFVITQEDIRRSGARSIPEALRLAPGVEVARIDENKWAIGSRGFNGRFANKLLVLIDGRTVYTPLFSGVYWNVQDVMVEDVDRIEVIRGPGATLWGANAVNGVINVITKSAQATQSGLITAEAGTEERILSGARYGGTIKDRGFYRAYTKYSKWASSTDATGQDAFDGWDTLHGGFRFDSNMPGDNSYTVQGDIYHSGYGETLTAPTLTAPYLTTFRNNGDFSGGNILARWNRTFSKSTTSLQMYYDKTNTSADSLLVDHQNIYDIDFQHDVRVNEHQELIWGVGYRSTQDHILSSPAVTLDPDHRSLSLFSGFVQNEFNTFTNHLRITLGSKFEHNGFTGFEFEPNARALWTLNRKHSVWGAVSRAVRTPARTEEDMRLNAAVLPPSAQTLGLPAEVSVYGNKAFKSEDLVAYEAGYRLQWSPAFSADVTTFYNSYSNLLSAEPGAPFLELTPNPPHLVVPLVAANKMSGGTYGTELFADWKVVPKWRVSGSYSYLHMNIRRNVDSLDQSSLDPAGISPSHQFYVRSSIDLLKNLEPDITLRYVDSLSGLAIPSYYSLDAHIGWKPVGPVELSLGAKNLLDHQHLEFRPDFITTSPTQVKRTFYGTITWRF